MKEQNRWEELFEGWLDLTDFTLIKYNDGWGLYDKQCGNLGDIENDRFENTTQIVDRMEIYINDYIFEDLEEELDAYKVDTEGREVPWSAEEWLAMRDDTEFYNKNKKYFESHKWEFDVLDMFANHTNEVDLENVFYESEESE